MDIRVKLEVYDSDNRKTRWTGRIIGFRWNTDGNGRVRTIWRGEIWVDRGATGDVHVGLISLEKSILGRCSILVQIFMFIYRIYRYRVSVALDLPNIFVQFINTMFFMYIDSIVRIRDFK